MNGDVITGINGTRSNAIRISLFSNDQRLAALG